LVDALQPSSFLFFAILIPFLRIALRSDFSRTRWFESHFLID
jgi:hypothetical protein